MAIGVSSTHADGPTASKQGDPDDPNGDSSESSDSLWDDEEVLRKHRQMRIADIITTKETKLFGEVIRIATGENFLQAVDSVSPDVFVVAHLYEPYLRTCLVSST